MNKLGVILCAALLTLGFLPGCHNSNESAFVSSDEAVISESADKEESVASNAPEPEIPSRFQEVYRQKLPENVLFLAWLSATQVYWVTQNRGAESITYALYIADVSKGTENLVFERSVKASHNLDMAVSLSDNKLHLFLRDNSNAPTYSKVTLSTDDWKIISEEPLNLTGDISWSQKSKQDIMVGQDINWKIILYPLESPEQFYPLKQFNKTRYVFASITWSPSGEYFILANNDALGMDRFEALADLIAYPKDEWPTARQYDVFKKDGSFSFSVAVDFTHKDDGSEASFDMFWMPGDQIYIASTFYDATLDTKQSRDRIINSSGTVVYEKAYEGDRNYFSSVGFVDGGVYYDEKKDDAIHMMQLSFLTGEVTDYGPIPDSDDLVLVSPHISPDRTLLLLQDRQDTAIRVLELNK